MVHVKDLFSCLMPLPKRMEMYDDCYPKRAEGNQIDRKTMNTDVIDLSKPIHNVESIAFHTDHDKKGVHDLSVVVDAEERSKNKRKLLFHPFKVFPIYLARNIDQSENNLKKETSIPSISRIKSEETSNFKREVSIPNISRTKSGEIGILNGTDIFIPNQNKTKLKEEVVIPGAISPILVEENVFQVVLKLFIDEQHEEVLSASSDSSDGTMSQLTCDDNFDPISSFRSLDIVEGYESASC
mmetsp:Transcript_2454/g.3269  ORF Transcript_2454/g.3269 Transcript_2454/m.3269 type:complete len:241 (+) Transcript_2454:94-816(+)